MFDLCIKLLLQAVASLQYRSNLKIQLAFHVTAEDSSSDGESSDDEEKPGPCSKGVKLENACPCLVRKNLDCSVMYSYAVITI